MTTALVQQINDFAPAFNQTTSAIDQRMSEVLGFLARIPLLPQSAVTPWVDGYNAKMGELRGHAQTVVDGFGDATTMCYTAMTIREAGEHWRDVIVPDKCTPVASGLIRAHMEGNFTYSWRSAAVDDYWSYIDATHDTAAALAGLGQQVSEHLLALADAIDKQNSDLGWAILGAIGSLLGAVGSGIGLGLAIGAITGLPAGGVGAIPGALIGALIGAIVGLIGGIIGLIASIKAWVDAAHVISDAGAEQLSALTANVATVAQDPWAASHQLYGAESFQQ